MADASTWVGHVAGTARDHVDVQVRDGLAGQRSVVDPEVQVGDPVLVREVVADLVDEREQRRPLLLRRVEPRRQMPERHDERVSFGDRVLVADGEGVRVTAHEPQLLGLAEGAGVRHGDDGVGVERVRHGPVHFPASHHVLS